MGARDERQLTGRSPFGVITGITGGIAFWLVAGSLLFPLGPLFQRAVTLTTGHGTWWPRPYYWHAIRFTWEQAAWSTAASLVLGGAAAWLASEHRVPGCAFFDRLALVAFHAPSLVVALIVIESLTWFGVEPFGWTGIVTAHTFFNAPLFYRRLRLALHDRGRLEECVAVLFGMRRARAFAGITVRKVLPEILGATALCFLLCNLSFATVLVLGGTPRFTTTEVAIYQALRTEFDLRAAIGVAAVQLLTGTVLSFVRLAVERRRLAPRPSSEGRGLFALRGRFGRTGAAILFYASFGFPLFFGFGLFVGRSLAASGGAPWGEILIAAGRSLLLATTVGALATSLAWAIARLETRALADTVASLPVAFSPSLLLVAWSLVFAFWRWPYGGNLAAIAWAQTLFALPLVYPVIRDARRQLPAEWIAIARTFGATPSRLFRYLEWPALAAETRLAFALGAGFSLGENACGILFAGSDDAATLPLWIYRTLGRYDVEAAMTGACVLLGLVFLFSLYARSHNPKKSARPRPRSFASAAG